MPCGRWRQRRRRPGTHARDGRGFLGGGVAHVLHGPAGGARRHSCTARYPRLSLSGWWLFVLAPTLHAGLAATTLINGR